MAFLETSIPRFFRVEDTSEIVVMVALESHVGHGWHYHWAVRGLGKRSLSRSKFRELCMLLQGFFGKWSYAAFGRDWAGLEQYFMKNCMGQGLNNGIFISTDPKRDIEAILHEAEDRKKHQKLGNSEKNKLAMELYTKGDIQNMAYNTDLNIRMDQFEKWIGGCRLVNQLRPLTQVEKDRIYNTEIYWIHGKSRTGKTQAAVNFYTTEVPGDANSRQLSYVKMCATSITKGFMNGYEA